VSEDREGTGEKPNGNKRAKKSGPAGFRLQAYGKGRAVADPELGASPDRADAMVWALTELMLGKAAAPPRVRSL
jgi:hypothetical protein